MCVIVRVCVIVHVCVITSFLGRQPADPAAHGCEGAQVLLQALVRLLVQPGHGAELGPVEAAQVGVEHHAKGRHHPVEVCLLPPRPPAHGTDTQEAGVKMKCCGSGRSAVASLRSILNPYVYMKHHVYMTKCKCTH